MPEYIQYDLTSSPVTGMIIKKWYSVDPSVVDGLPFILKIPRDTFRALTKFHVVDSGAVREMTQQEKDALTAYEQAQAEQAETDRINALDDLIDSGEIPSMVLTKIDNAIDNIGSLADAKAFLKKQCRYIIKFIARM